MDFFRVDLLQHVLRHCRPLDALNLARTCKTLGRDVKAEWRRRRRTAPTLVLLVGSASNRLLLLHVATGRVLRSVSIHSGDAAGSPWPPGLAVHPSLTRCFVSEYETRGVLEFALPELTFTRSHPAAELGLPGWAQPEGVAATADRLYVAWARHAVSAAALGAAGHAVSPLGAREMRWHRAHPILWGCAVGPAGDAALYIAANPPYGRQGQPYGSMPAAKQQGRGSVLRLPLTSEGGIDPAARPEQFTDPGHLSRPGGVCFDEAGDLYVCHNALQVLRFAGPHRGDAAGSFMGVFIDTALPQHGLVPDLQAFRPCPTSICCHGGAFYLTTHTTRGVGQPNHGCLSVWSPQGELLVVHRLAEGLCSHPNAVAVFAPAAPLPAGMQLPDMLRHRGASKAPGAAPGAPAAATGRPVPSALPRGSPLVTRQRVVALPDRHIPPSEVTDAQLLSAVQGYLGAEDQQRLRLLQHLLLGTCREAQSGAGRELLEGFAALASGKATIQPGAASKPGQLEPALPQSLSAAGSGAAAAAAAAGGAAAEAAPASRAAAAEGAGTEAPPAQLPFLRQLCSAMRASGYRLLTRPEWEAALCEGFLSTLPVVADYCAMDAGLLPAALWREELADADAESAEPPPQLAGRALIWHRGAEPVRASTQAWAIKLELLISFYLLQPLWAALAWLAALVGLRPARAQGVPGLSSRPGEQPSSLDLRAPGTCAAQPAPPGSGEQPGEGEALGPGSQVIERHTFARAFPDGRSVLRQLARPVQLQEACFRDVVLLYRPASASTPAGAAPALGRGGQAGGGMEGSVGGQTDQEALVLKQYRRLPLADLEMVLPGARIFLPPNLYLSMAFTLVAGLAAAAVTLWQGAWGVGMLRAVATILLTRAYQLYTYIKNERTAIAEHMTKLLYERATASQEAVLHTLLAEAAGQRARELLLCYAVLLEAGRELPELEVSARCRRLLASCCGHSRLSLDAGDSLHQLAHWGLAKRRLAGPEPGLPGQLAARAVPLAQAVGNLREVWRSLAELDSEGAEALPVTPPASPRALPAAQAAGLRASHDAPARRAASTEAEASSTTSTAGDEEASWREGQALPLAPATPAAAAASLPSPAPVPELPVGSGMPAAAGMQAVKAGLHSPVTAQRLSSPPSGGGPATPKHHLGQLFKLGGGSA